MKFYIQFCVFPLIYKLLFKLRFSLVAREIFVVLWQLYEVNLQNCRRKKLSDENAKNLGGYLEKMENDLSCYSNDQWYLFFVFTFRSVQLTYKWTFTLFSWNVQWYLQPFGQAGWWVYTLTVKEMSLKHQNRPSEQNFLTNIFKSKPQPSVASGHAQMTHFELWSNVAGQFFWYFKTTLVSQAREARDIIDKTLKLPKTYAFFSKKVNRRRHFQILMT